MPLDGDLLIGFLLVGGAIVLSPGPDTLLVTRNSLQGRSVGLATVIGVQLGMLCHSVLAVLGVSALLAAWPTGLQAIAVAGAAYLAWLGVQCFRSGFLSLSDLDAGAVAPRRALRDAFFTNLLNPKVILLYVSLMPPFVAPALGRIWLQLSIFCALLLLMTLAWQIPLWLLAGRARALLARPAVQRAVNWSTGAILLFFAMLLLWDHLLKTRL
jgi:homoserine/homoserine lactone efflux protein